MLVSSLAKWTLDVMERFPRSKTLYLLFSFVSKSLRPMRLCLCREDWLQMWPAVWYGCLSVLQIQGVCVSAVQTASLLGVVSGREGGDAAPPGGQEGKSCVLDLHRGQTGLYTQFPKMANISLLFEAVLCTSVIKNWVKYSPKVKSVQQSFCCQLVNAEAVYWEVMV